METQFVRSPLTGSDFRTLDFKISKAVSGDSGVALGYRIELATVDFKFSKATYQTFSDFKRWMQKKETKKMKEDKGSLSGW